MSTDTLPDDATTEQITEYVQSKFAGDKEPETDESTTKPEDSTDVDESADQESADDSVADSSEEVAGEVETQEEESWIDDDVRGLASAFKISEEQLSGMSGRDELERTLSLMDRFVQKPESSGGDQTPPKEETPPQRHPDYPDRRPDGTLLPKGQREEKGDQRSDTGFQIDLDPEEHGEEVVNMLKKMHEHYEQKFDALNKEYGERIASQERIEAQQRAAQFITVFDNTVDAIGQPEFFGETGKETDEQMQRREALMGEFNKRDIDLNGPALTWLARGTFPEHFQKQQLIARTKQGLAQSGQKLGESENKSPEPKESLRDKVRRIHKEMDSGS